MTLLREAKVCKSKQFDCILHNGIQIWSGGAEMRVKITLACTECKQRNYNSKKNKKNDPDRLEMNKYCKFCKKHTLHKETK
jgi:large subunit ribosomal protein L33